MYRDRSYGNRQLNVPAIGCIGVVIILVLLIALAAGPAFHWFFFDWFYLNPIFWLLVVLAFLSLLITISDNSWAKAIGDIGVVLFCGLAVWYMLFAGPTADEKLVKGIQPEKLVTMPDTTGVRYLPHEVAVTYAKSKMNDPAYVIGDLDPLDYNGQLFYIAPRIPNGWYNAINGSKTAGVMIIKSDGQVDDSFHQSQTYGEGMYITNNILWQLFAKKYWCEIPETYYVIYNGEILTMSPYITYHFDFPVMVPEWGGVFVLHSDGRIEDLTPDQAINDPRFVDQRLYPEEMARRIGNGWQYRGGVPNSLFTHNDQTELPRIKDSENQMPYLLPSDPNPYWFVGLEPHGSSYSIYKMLFTDAHTGKISIFEIPKERNLVGPNKAIDFVKAAFPTTQWYRETGDTTGGTIVAIEPKPIILKGVLYWQVSITNLDHAGVTRTAVINANTQKVVYFDSQDELNLFLEGKFDGRVPENQAGLQPSQPATGTEVPGGLDLSKLSDKQLLDLLNQIVGEMERRSK